MKRTRTGGLVLLVALLGASACTAGTPAHRGTDHGTKAAPATSSPIRVGGTRTLAGAERSYGPSVGTIPGAVYQPDVVVIGGGAKAIVGALDNGLVWTIRGSAPGADKLAVGKIMAATSFATGRVAQVRQVSGNVQVLLTPVGLTDVFKELHVDSSSPVALDQPLAYRYGNSPLASTDGDSGVTAVPPAPSASRSTPPSVPPIPRFLSGVGPNRDAPAVPAVPAVPTAVPTLSLPEPEVSPKAVHQGKLDMIPYCCYPSQGIHVSYSEPAGRMAATVGIVMGSKPLVDFHIDITAAGLQEAVFELNGPKAIEFQFDAATKDVSGNYRSPTFTLPLAFTFPIAGIPFTVELNQSIHASLQLAGQAAFSSKGEYAIQGGLGFAYRHGQIGGTSPTFSSKVSSLQNATSLAVGINALSIGYTAHFSVGIGVPGFNGGIHFDLNANLAIDKDGSPPQTTLTLGCATAAVSITATFGVGYTIPKFVADTVNTFLKLFRAKPIKPTGGRSWGPYTLWDPGSGTRCIKR